MKHRYCILIPLMVLAACREQAARTTANASVKELTTPASGPADTMVSWKDSLVVHYLNATDQESIRLVRADTIPMEWIHDRNEETDTAVYLIYHLGHTFEHRFITDGWLYIDSARRKLYEYDLANDRLLPFTR